MPVMVLALGVLMTAGLFAGGSKEADGSAKTIYAATGGRPRPFSFVDETGKTAGYDIELLEAVFARLPQYRLQIEVTDFPSIFAGLDAGRYQIGVNNFAENEERKQKYIFSNPIFKNRFVAAVAESNTTLGNQIRTLADLAGRTTANQVGLNMATAIENYNKANPDKRIIQDFSDADLAVRLQEVESGRYDFNLIDKPLFEFYQREFKYKLRGIELSTEVSGAVLPTPYSYLLIGKGSETLASEINAALKEVILDGTSRKLSEKYFGSDYSPEAR
jgi:polar amino acid transport system substrate-binding protein